MKKINLTITREADDPLALRASIGGGKGLVPQDTFYLVYRGEPMEVLRMLKDVVKVAEVELPKRARPRG